MASTIKRIAIWIGGLFLALIASFVFRTWHDFRSHRTTQQQEATRLIGQFHRRLNSGDLEAICQDAYKCNDLPNLREDWQRLLDDTRRRGGTFQGVVRSDIDVYDEPPSVRADVLSSFEKGVVREIFIMKDYDGPLKIVSYQTVTK